MRLYCLPRRIISLPSGKKKHTPRTRNPGQEEKENNTGPKKKIFQVVTYLLTG